MRKGRLSAYKQHKLVEHFVAGATAPCAWVLVKVNKNTAALYFQRLSELIAHPMEREESEVFEGEIEVDESYFGGARKGNRGPGASAKAPVFGLLKRGGKVYTHVITDAKSTTLMPLIRKKVVPDSLVYTDCWRPHNGFVAQMIIRDEGFL